ncbi:putative DNA binding domain-containing protein [candidate division KSB1 bacterium]|nr:putative DNA binding domain-containing protein [candidate division KSB1 bacterium]
MSLFENPTIDEILQEKEGQLFERKSARIDPRDLANHFVAFANADGGFVAIGIEDDGTITGITEHEMKINSFLQSVWDLCVPPVPIIHQFIDCLNHRRKADQILFIEVIQSGKLHANTKDEVYLRIGDQSRKLSFDERMQLAYDRGAASWESALVPDFPLNELNTEVLERYRTTIGTSLTIQQLLPARRLAELKDDRLILNRAGVLLFANNPCLWFPRADFRFLRYEGTTAETGPRMNLVKDIRLELPLPKLLDEAFRSVAAQLREFTRLVPGGKFETTLEYPVFAWQEAISNAVIHRAYGITGTDIQMKMFDDRLEVESPGKLPGLVRLHNLRDIHFSRNPLIARVMTEMKYMRELGEGIDRMILEMEQMGLEMPVFEEYAFMVRVTLRNNLEKRSLNLSARAEGADESTELNQRQRALFVYLSEHNSISRLEYEQMFEVSEKTAKRDLHKLLTKGFIEKIGEAKRIRYKISNQLYASPWKLSGS